MCAGRPRDSRGQLRPTVRHPQAGPEGDDSRIGRIIARVQDIPEGFVRSYGDIDPGAPRLVGRVLAGTDESLPWHRVVRADGSLAKGRLQRELLLREGVPMRGDRVDLRQARLPRHI
jgi:methylated-DNA-protein-cysteine methyltransferase-like protein